MLQLSDENLTDFKSIYKKHTGIELSEQETLKYALSLVNFTNTVLKYDENK